jgi:hypothetical protein
MGGTLLSPDRSFGRRPHGCRAHVGGIDALSAKTFGGLEDETVAATAPTMGKASLRLLIADTGPNRA